MKRLMFALAFGLMLAIIVIPLTGGIGSIEKYEKALLEASVDEQIREQGFETLVKTEDATNGQKWLLANYGLRAYLAEKQYPEQAVSLYLLFGHTDEFKEVVGRCGHEQTVPALWHFFSNESISFEIRDSMGKAFARIKEWSTESKLALQESLERSLTPDERAWIAVHRIKESRCGYLAQFFVDEKGVAHRSNTRRAFAFAEELLVSNIEALEWKYKAEEKIGAGDVAWALVDATFLGFVGAKVLLGTRMLAGIGTSTKIASHGKFTALLSRTATLAPKVWRGSKAAHLGKWATVGLGGYLLWRHPSAFNAGIGAVAEFFGISKTMLQLATWALVFAIPLYMFGWLWFLIGRPFARWIGFPLIRIAIRTLRTTPS